MDRGDRLHDDDPPPRSVRKTHRPSRSERVKRGKSARRPAPRSSHGTWQAAAGRPDPVDLLEEQAASRVPELVPIRYGRMLVSPFAFYRGAALVMANDLASTPDSGITVQCCGDAHLSNFGVFGSPERRLIFDINDFDETLPGPWEWDVKRLAASFEIAGRDRGFSRSDRRRGRPGRRAEYRLGMRNAATQGTLDVWYSHMEVGQMLEWIRTEDSDERLGRRAGKDRSWMWPRPGPATASGLRRAHRAGRRRPAFRRGPAAHRAARRSGPARRPAPTERSCASWSRVPPDTGRRAPSAGGVPVPPHGPQGGRRGQRRDPRAGSSSCSGVDDRDPLILQAKEAQPSVLERFAGRSAYGNHGQRVVVGQRLMQTASDIFLGWQRVKDIDGDPRDYYVRQLHDWKGSAHVDTLRVAGATTYARMCGATLARAHARRATGSPSPPIWVKATGSTGRSPTSLPRTPTRTNGTTRSWSGPSGPVGWRPSPACSRARNRGVAIGSRLSTNGGRSVKEAADGH